VYYWKQKFKEILLEATCDREGLGNVKDGKKLEGRWLCMSQSIHVECGVDALVLQTAWGTFAETQGARLVLTMLPRTPCMW
jgi:hypothetical protein